MKEDGHTITHVLNAILDNDETGQRIRVHDQAHTTLRDGEVTVAFSDIDLDCVQ